MTGLKQNKDLSLLNKINLFIDEQDKTFADLGVLSGISGIMMFKFLYADYTSSAKEFEKAKELLQLGLEKINQGYNYPSFCLGIAGFCWSLQFLKENDLAHFEGEELFVETDSFLAEVLAVDLANQNYDFLHGAIGIGIYFVKRYRYLNDSLEKEKYSKSILSVIDFLDASKLVVRDGVTWCSWQDSDVEGSKMIDLGLAHGISSILYFLSLVHEAGLDHLKTEHLIKKSINFVLSKKHTNKAETTLFPVYLYDNTDLTRKSDRIGWCYGDLGIGLSMLKGARVLKSSALEKEALEILHHTALRRGAKENAVFENSICHGTFGLSQIFGRLNKKLKDPVYKEASDYWKKMGHEMTQYNTNNNVIYSVYENQQENLIKSISVLEGLTGMGLSLISQLTDFKFEWDECLLVT